MLIPLTEITTARERLQPWLPASPVVHADSYSQRTGANVYLKLELLLPTHSFKVRGALNAILALSPTERERGLITASGGNHGLGVSFAAQQTKSRAVVVLPEVSPQVRRDRIKELGAELIVHGADWNAANARALELAAEQGLTYVSPFADRAIMAGQGTIALELLEQLPDVDVVFCSVGGGGLISGIASALRQLKPEVRVIGVETRGADCVSQSLAAGRVVELAAFTSIAESLGTRRSTPEILQIISDAAERVVVVEDRAALDELVFTLDYEKLLLEPAASCNLAALTGGTIPDLAGRNIAMIACGGNIRYSQVTHWLEQFNSAERA
jgi:threonine dehydratase